MTKIYTTLNKEESLPENHDIDEGEDEGEHAFRHQCNEKTSERKNKNPDRERKKSAHD